MNFSANSSKDFPADNCVYTISKLVPGTDLSAPLKRDSQICLERQPTQFNWIWNRTFNGGMDQHFKILPTDTDTFHIRSAVDDHFATANKEEGGLDLVPMPTDVDERAEWKDKAEWRFGSVTQVDTSSDETVDWAWTVKIESAKYPGQALSGMNPSPTDSWYEQEKVLPFVKVADADTWLLQARPVQKVESRMPSWDGPGVSLKSDGKYFCFARGTVEMGAGKDIVCMAHGVVNDRDEAIKNTGGVLSNREMKDLVEPHFTPYAMISMVGTKTFAPPQVLNQHSKNGAMSSVNTDDSEKVHWVQFEIGDVHGNLRYIFNDTRGDHPDNVGHFDVVVTRRN